jgi:hypothetical protein
MTVAHVGSTGTTTTATAYGTTSTTVAYTSVAVGRMAIIVASTKLSTATWSAVTGFTQIVDGTGGTGASSSTTGTTRIGVWYRILDGSETGSVTVATTGGVATTAAMSVYSKTRNTWMVPFGVTSSDTTDGTNPTGTAAAWTKTLIPADMLIAAYAGEEGSTTVPSANTLTQTSATFGTRTHRNYRNNSSGTTNTLTSWDGTVTTANNTNALTTTLTWTVSTAGAFAAVVLRDYQTTLSNTLDGGTDTVTISTGNSGGGSGNAFDFVQIPATASAVYTAANKARGTLGAAVSSGSTPGITYLQYSTSINGGSDVPIYARVRYKVTALPAAQFRLAVIAGGDGSFQGDYRLNTDGTIGLYTGTGTLVSATTATITANQWFDLGFAITVFSASVGVSELKLYLNPSSNTATETETSGSINTLRNGGLNALQVGVLTSTVASQPIYIDDIQTSTTGYPSAIPMEVSGIAALSVESTLTSGSLVTTTGASALSGQSTMTVVGTVITGAVTGSSALSAQSNMTVTGTVTTTGAATLSAQSTMTSVGSNTVIGSTALSGQSNLAIVGTRVVNGSAVLSAQSNMVTLAKGTTQGIAALSAQSNMTVVGSTFTTPPSASLSGQFNMTVTGSVTVKGASTLSIQSNMSAIAKLTIGGVATLTAQSSIASIGTRVVTGAAVLSAQSTLTAVGLVPAILTGSVAFTIQSGLSVQANVTPPWVFPFIEFDRNEVTGMDSKDSISGIREGLVTVSIQPESKSTSVVREGG